MRERLIELIREAFNANGGETTVDKAADHLLANGVIVPPCKVGDTVWFNTYEKNATVCVGVQPHKVISYRLGMVVETTLGTPTTVLPEYEFGRSVFLTREEAEQALKGDAW